MEGNLFKKYSKTIAHFSMKYERKCRPSVLLDRQALEQEALFVLNSALESYNFGEVSFLTYLSSCLDNHFTNLLRQHMMGKIFKQVDNIEDLNFQDSSNPENFAYASEILDEVYKSIIPFDRKVFELIVLKRNTEVLLGQINSIAVTLNESPQRVKRAIKRIRQVASHVIFRGDYEWRYRKMT